MTELFGVKDYNKTYHNHYREIVKLLDSPLVYTDVVDSDFWQSVYTQAWDKWQLMCTGWASDLSEKRQARAKAQVINYYTRVAIQGSLKFNGLPESYDTAFYMKYYKDINKGMMEVLKSL